MSNEAAIGSLAPWFGGKRTMAPEIVREIGPHGAYWEPFCGSMAVLMAKPSAPFEVVNDLHGDLINLARVVQDARLGPALYRRLRRVPFSEAFFRESRAALAGADGPGPAPDLERAFHYFVLSWQGMNGVSGTPMHHLHFARRFSSKGGAPGIRWSSAVRSIPAWRRRLERVMILSADAFELLGKIEDREGTAIYCDPPYVAKGANYLHDFAAADHGRLAGALARFRLTRVVVSYYEHPDLAGLYPGWNVRRVEMTKALVSSGMRDETGATKAPEILIINGPILGGDLEALPLFARPA